VSAVCRRHTHLNNF